MNKLLHGRVALVTGASRNIGRATALALAGQGAKLVLCTRESGDALAEVAKEVTAMGSEVLATLCDVTRADDIDKLARQALDRFGKVDIVVNNATYRTHKGLTVLDDDAWDRAIAVNLTAPFRVCRAFLPSMVEQQWGRVVNFSGNSAFSGGAPAMSAAKLGIVGLTRAIAREFGPHGITANCLSPGGIAVTRTPGTERPSDRAGQVDSSLPVARFGTVEEVASMVTYLASDAAAYVTGQCIAVNGGAHFI